MLGISLLKCFALTSQTIYLGMNKKAISKLYRLKSTEINLMINSANFGQIYKIDYNNTTIELSFDDNNHLNYLGTEDTSYKVDGNIGIGSSFLELKKYYKKYNVIEIIGYGKYVEIVDKRIFFYFIWKELKNKFILPLYEDKSIIILDQEKVKWLEFKRLDYPTTIIKK